MISGINSSHHYSQYFILFCFFFSLGIICSNPCSDLEYYFNQNCYPCNVPMCSKCYAEGICEKCIEGYVLERNRTECTQCNTEICSNTSIPEIRSNITRNSTDSLVDEDELSRTISSGSNYLDQTMSSNDWNDRFNETNNSNIEQVNSVDEDNITNNTNDDDVNETDNINDELSQNNTNDLPPNQTENATETLPNNTEHNNTDSNETHNETTNETDNNTNNTKNNTNESLCFQAFTSVFNECQPCPNNCLVCNNPMFCVECLPNYFISENKCSRCSPGCEQCSSKIKCSKCRLGYRLVNKNSSESCVQLGYKINAMIQTQISGKEYWVSCGYGCKFCGFVNASLTCMSCVEGKYLTEQKVCLPCLSPCLNCFANGPIIKCKSCPPFYTLLESNCIECIQSNCLSCESPSVCTMCSPGYTLKEDNCIKCSALCLACNLTSCLSCEIGHVPWNDTCIECASNCGTCSVNNISECTSCENGFNLIDGACLICGSNCMECSAKKCTECKFGYGIIGGNCLEYCDDECVRCEYDIRDSRLECRECLYGYEIENGKCKEKSNGGIGTIAPFCLLNQYLSSTCLPCSKFKCEQCSLSSSVEVCLQCSEGYFPNPDCVACPENCSICNSLQICNECKPTFYLELYLNSPTGRCLACNVKAGCLECFGSASQCLKCLDGYEREGFKCITKERLGLWLHLFEKPSEVIERMAELKYYILRILGMKYVEEFGWITIRKFEKGSTNINISISIPPELNIESSASNILTAISSNHFPFTLINQPSIQYENFIPKSNTITSSRDSSSTSGIIVGCVIAVIILIIIILIVCFKIKNKKQTNQNDIQYGSENAIARSGNLRQQRREERKRGRKQTEEKLDLDEVKTDNMTEEFN